MRGRIAYVRLTTWTAAVLIGALAACVPGERAEPSLPVTESRGPAGPVMDGLAKYYGQKITWRDCAGFATTPSDEESFSARGLQCARIRVPLDYAAPDGSAITIAVLRLPATGSKGDRIGSLLINPGGPGASGMTAAADLRSTRAFERLNERFDIVGFDPRGVGASRPALRCLTDAERDADRADDGEFDGSAEGVARTEAEERTFARNCAARTKHGKRMLANLGTRDVVRDMDVLRSALGDQKLSYVGYSYGTRIGYAYAEAFPRNVRSLLLDGALDPEQDVIASLIAQGRGFGEAFDDFAGWCTARQDCALGSDPDQATARFQRLARPLIRQHVDIVDGRELSFEDLDTATIQGLYTPQLWETLNAGLNELDRGRGETLMALADLYTERAPDGTYAGTLDAQLAIRCVDDPAVTDRQRIRAAGREYAALAPFRDPGLPIGDARDTCAFWPVANTSQPHLPKLPRSMPEALVISTTKDPATPYQAGVRLAKAMHASLLTFAGTQHTVFGLGNRCVDDIGVDYLLDNKLPEKGKRCN